MKNNVEDFIEEITTNFSELFVETFFIRYLSDYDVNDLEKVLKKLKVKLNSKINDRLNEKLELMFLKKYDD